jgi:hypothetical protein
MNLDSAIEGVLRSLRIPPTAAFRIKMAKDVMKDFTGTCEERDVRGDFY